MSVFARNVFILCVSILVAAAAHAGQGPAAVAAPAGLLKLDGRAAPALVLQDMDGKRIDIKARRGHWLLVHFWASWCGPCRKELPTLERLVQQIPASRVELIMVNTAETDDQVFAFLPTLAPTLGSYLDRDGSVTERWQPRGLPSSFLVDPKGRLRYVALGGREWDSPAYLSFLRALNTK